MTTGLIQLDIKDFRNLSTVTIQPIKDGFNYIYGQNGSGKTSILEAIYYLSLGRSFRSTVLGRVIQKSAEKLTLFGRINTLEDQIISLGLERNTQSDAKIRIDGADARSIAELANAMPVQLIDSNCHHLIDAGPSFRRKYIDWGLFYQDGDFLRAWKRFQASIKQRNAGLRQRVSRQELEGWTRELITAAQPLEELRSHYLTQLIPILKENMAELLNLSSLNIEYYSGWDITKDYAAILQQYLDKDYQLGYTQFGPHKADLKLTIRGVPAKDILSRGQQKLFVCGMILAQGTLLQQCTDRRPIYLVDDLPSELDKTSRENLINLLSRQKSQVFVTAIEYDKQSDVSTNRPIKMFHVEHGVVTEIN